MVPTIAFPQQVSFFAIATRAANTIEGTRVDGTEKRAPVQKMSGLISILH